MKEKIRNMEAGRRREHEEEAKMREELNQIIDWKNEMEKKVTERSEELGNIVEGAQK